MCACESRIGVSASANTPSEFTHVHVTVNEVWMHANASAPPDDPAWIRFPLSSPQTLDLAALTSGEIVEFARELPLPPGSYGQMRLILSETTGSLAPGTQRLGAAFNNEVVLLDETGVELRVPLQVLNATTGIGVPVNLQVPAPMDAILAAFSSPGTAGRTSPPSGTPSSIGFGSTTGVRAPAGTGTNPVPSRDSGTGTGGDSTGGPGSGTGDTGSGTSVESGDLGTTTANAAIVFDAARDVVPFTVSTETRFSIETGFVLNAQVAAVTLDEAGTISGHFLFDALPIPASGVPEVHVTAQMPAPDESRHVPVLSTRVGADGTFVLYPLPQDDAHPDEYDLVIHGPQLQTTIIRSVPVAAVAPDSTGSVQFTNFPLLPADAYAANIPSSNAVTVAGARVGFYQTLSGRGEIPYLIAERAVDPLVGSLPEDQVLPIGEIAVGTFSAGGAITLNIVPPVEGAGSYTPALSAPVYGAGAFGRPISPPADLSTTVSFEPPSLEPPSGTSSGVINATIDIAAPGRFDDGALIVTRDGAMVTATSLGAILSSAQPSGSVTLSDIPAGTAGTAFDSGLYQMEIWAWSTREPGSTFTRQPLAESVDLRSTDTANITVTLN